MTLTSSMTTLAAAEEAQGSLPMPAWAFGVVAIGVFVTLLAVVWSFRNNGAKHGQHRGSAQAGHAVTQAEHSAGGHGGQH